MSEHTQLPWRVDRSHDIEWEGVSVWSGDVLIAHVVADQHGEEEANAALIVRAVNAHNDLLRAVKLALALVMTNPFTGERKIALDPKAEEQLRRAVAKAEGEE